MKASGPLLATIIIASAGIMTVSSGCVFDVFRLPEAALEREETRPDCGGVLSLAYSPDGSQLASSHDTLFPFEWRVQSFPLPPQIRLWTSDQPGMPPKRLAAVFSAPHWDWNWPILIFSRDSKQLYAETQKGLLRWDIPGQRLDQFFEGDHVTISPDGHTVARNFHERNTVEVVFQEDDSDEKNERPRTDLKKAPRVELVDLRNGARVTTLNHTTELTPGYFSPNGEFLACYGDDGRVSIWRISSQSWRYQIRAQALPRGVFSPNGQWFATQEPNEGPVEIWDVRPGNHLDLPVQASLPTGGGVWCLAFSPDGKILAVGREGDNRREGQIQFWDVTTGRQIAKMRDRSTWGITALCFSPDGATLASGSGEGAIKFWQVAKTSK